ncbi:MAG: hypothetical protein PVH68_12395 [Armatimonadota bacterium]|jgi:predicted anti-sigma-YlaC factor YlaD
MTCKQAREHLADFTVAALEDAARCAVQAHLEACAECRRAHDELVATGDLLDTTELLQPSRDLWPEVRTALSERRPARAAWWRLQWLPRPRWAVASAAAAAAAAAIVALAIFLPPPEPIDITTATDEDAALFTQWHAGAALQGGFGDAHAIAVLLHTAPEELEEAGES